MADLPQLTVRVLPNVTQVRSERHQIVSRILRKRTYEGKIQYLVKWLGCSDSENSWEDRDSLSCAAVINDFERNRMQVERDRAAAKREAARTRAACHAYDEPAPVARGFARGLQPEKIVGATGDTGELLFLMKWKGSKFVDLCPATEANWRCPQVVIEYYEEHLFWRMKKDDENF